MSTCWPPREEQSCGALTRSKSDDASCEEGCAATRLAFVKYFIFLRILRHHKVIALALGAPGVGAGGRPADPAPTGGPEMLAQLGTTRS